MGQRVPAEQWKHSHNFVHHTFTNVLGKDNDVGYGILRVAPEQPWSPAHLPQPLYNLLLAMFFEYGVALHDLEIDKIRAGTADMVVTKDKLRQIGRKIRRQWGKDYLAFPLLSGPQFASTLAANFTANVARNVWAHMIIFCGHFPGDVEVFEEERLDGETKGEWYVRQLCGSANISGGALFHLMTGNLSHQIEHHLFPDMPSNRYAEIARASGNCATSTTSRTTQPGGDPPARRPSAEGLSDREVEAGRVVRDGGAVLHDRGGERGTQAAFLRPGDQLRVPVVDVDPYRPFGDDLVHQCKRGLGVLRDDGTNDDPVVVPPRPAVAHNTTLIPDDP